jgi:undecaprenyl diphosphate synthase
MTTLPSPQHIAIIMDGNGRWAKKRFLPRIAGHRAGVEVTRNIVKHCARLGVRVLTLFAFSSENWLRSDGEVNALMDLFLNSLKKEVPMLHENTIKLRFIGQRNRFNTALQQRIAEVENLMQANTGMVLLIAADYGGQWDICQAVQQLGKSIAAGDIKSEAIQPQDIAKYLSFADLPDPDLFIRTSGEIRISNFMLWQLAYAELYFTPVLWPDFTEAELDKAIDHYQQRDRRFGGVAVGKSDGKLI